MSNSKPFSLQNFINKIFGEIPIMYDKCGNIYSIGVPIAKGLGYTKPKDTIHLNVSKEYKFFLKDAEKYGVSSIKEIIPKRYNQPDTIILTEAGIYILIISSKKPLAKNFRDWLFSEIIPSIRKQGYYIDHIQKDYDQKSREVRVFREEVEKLLKENEDLTHRISEIRYSKHEVCMVKEIEFLEKIKELKKEIKELKKTIRTMRRK